MNIKWGRFIFAGLTGVGLSIIGINFFDDFA